MQSPSFPPHQVCWDIITEHADIAGEWYQEMVLEKWWDGKTKLVPIDWSKI